MTKKDYRIIAKAINKEYEYTHGDGVNNLDNVIMNLAFSFAKQNPRFDEQNFIDACKKRSV